MSWRALAYVEELQRHEDGTPLTCREKFILHIVAYFHDADWRYAEKSVTEIAWRALSSEKQTRRLIKSCERHRTLHVKRTRFAGRVRSEINHYYFLALEKRDGSVLWRQLSGDTMTPPPTDTMTARGDICDPTLSADRSQMSGKDFLEINTKTKPAAEPRRGETPPAIAGDSLPDSEKEREDRRKIEARDRREKAEAAARAARPAEGWSVSAEDAGVRVNPAALERARKRAAQ